MKTEEEHGRIAEMQTSALVKVVGKLQDIAIDDDIVFDPSLRMFNGTDADNCGVGYAVNDDGSHSVRIHIRVGGKELPLLMSKEDSLSFAADIIAFAMHLDEMNDPTI